MTDYTWPTSIIPSSSEWRLVANTAAFTSPLTGATRTLGRGGDRWACTVTTPALRAANRQIMRGFLAQLRGQMHRVVLGDHSYVKRGTQAANVGVYGGSQTGSTLQVHYATASATLLTGDLFQVGNELKMLTADTTFDGAGVGVLTFSPPLRASPAADDTVNILTPKARFILAGDTVGWSNMAGGISSFNVELVEDIT